MILFIKRSSFLSRRRNNIIDTRLIQFEEIILRSSKNLVICIFSFSSKL